MPKDDPYTKFRQPPTPAPAVGQPISVLPETLDPDLFTTPEAAGPAVETPPVPVTGGHAPPGWVPPPEMLSPPPTPEPTAAVLAGAGAITGRVLKASADPLLVAALDLIERGLAGGCSFMTNYHFRVCAVDLAAKIRKSVSES